MLLGCALTALSIPAPPGGKPAIPVRARWQAGCVPEMSSSARGFCTSRPYRLIARNVVLPWTLQGSRPRGELLEIGSGSGSMAAGLLSRFPDLRVTATDYDPEMVTVAGDALSQWSGRASVERADATSLPFEDGRFDFVLSCAMLHHVVDWERAVSEAARVLQPGGLLVGFDIVHSARRHLGRSHRHDGAQAHGSLAAHAAHAAGEKRMVDPGAFESELRRLPFDPVRVRMSRGGLAFRFLATRSV